MGEQGSHIDDGDAKNINVYGIGGLTQFVGGTQAVWDTVEIPVPNGLVVYAPDTTAIKVGNGSSRYSELPVLFNLSTILGLVDQVNANSTNVAILQAQMVGVQASLTSIVSQLTTLSLGGGLSDLGGDLSGTPATAEIVAIDGVPISVIGANPGDNITFDGTRFVPIAPPTTEDGGFF